MCLCVCLCVHHTDLSAMLCPLGSLRYRWNQLCKGMLYSEFHVILSNCSRNFHALHTNLAISAIFWANFYMLGIKMHVLELRNSLVILSKNFTRMFMQFHAIFTLFGLFQPFLGQFQHVGYQKACTRAYKFIGYTFTQFHACLHAISSKFHEIFT